MLHFFRKIRRDLLANSQFFKYLKYAVGEIVLVVLGILIALYINNQNEQRKEREKFDLTLVEVEKELIDNINFARNAIEGYAFLDKKYMELLLDSLKFDNLYVYRRLIKPLPNKSEIRDDSSKKLNYINNLSVEQEAIINDLTNLSRNGSIYFNDYSDKMKEFSDKSDEELRHFDWYENYLYMKQEDMRIWDFFYNDQEYLKMALERYSWISSYRYSLERYDKSAINVYQKIYNYLDSLGIKHSDSLLFQYNPDDYKHYLGKYDALWCSVKNEVLDDSIIISLEKGKLMYTGYRSVGPDTRMEIIPIGKNAFRDTRYDGGLYHLSYDDLGEVVGIRYGGGPTYTLTMKKIR